MRMIKFDWCIKDLKTTDRRSWINSRKVMKALIRQWRWGRTSYKKTGIIQFCNWFIVVRKQSNLTLKMSNLIEGMVLPYEALVKELVWEEENSDETLFLTTFGWVEELMESQSASPWCTAGAADLKLGREVEKRLKID